MNYFYSRVTKNLSLRVVQLLLELPLTLKPESESGQLSIMMLRKLIISTMKCDYRCAHT
jgi:hypothetical protein